MMKKTLNISIADNNQYYITGLRHALADFYLTKETPVRFIDDSSSTCEIDILFHAIRGGVPMGFFSLHPSSSTSQPFFFAIHDKKESALSLMSHHIRKNGILYRHQPIDSILDMVEQAMTVDEPTSVSVINSKLNKKITTREHEVLSYLKRGCSSTETASFMGLNVKTVSSHKRSAMKKLNFKRNQELLYWLLQSDLSNQSTQPTYGRN